MSTNNFDHHQDNDSVFCANSISFIGLKNNKKYESYSKQF